MDGGKFIEGERTRQGKVERKKRSPVWEGRSSLLPIGGTIQGEI